MGNVREVSSYSVTKGFFLVTKGFFLVSAHSLCHCEHLEGAWQSPFSPAPPRLLRRFAPRNDKTEASLRAPICRGVAISLAKFPNTKIQVPNADFFQHIPDKARTNPFKMKK